MVIKQIENSTNGCNIKIFYPTGLKPTRKNVLDKKAVGIYSGGVNYFPFYPMNKDVSAIDTLLQPFEDDVYSVSLKLMIKVMEQLESEVDDWNVKAFIGFINTLLATDPTAQGKLIVRRNRDIGKGTGRGSGFNYFIYSKLFPAGTDKENSWKVSWYRRKYNFCAPWYGNAFLFLFFHSSVYRFYKCRSAAWSYFFFPDFFSNG